MTKKQSVTDKIKSKYTTGYSLVELMLALVVGSVIIGATYASYNVVAKQYERLTAFSEVQEVGIPTIRIVGKDIRMAGYEALDANVDPALGTITTPITITDSGNACCDSVVVIYDIDTATRHRITYSTAQRTNPTRNALYKALDIWNTATSSWDSSYTQALVADYIEDFQVVGSDLDTNGDPTIVDLTLIVRSKAMLANASSYTNPTHNEGNYSFTENDYYHRDEFSATINVRNIR